MGFTGPFGVHPVFGVCPRRLDNGPQPRPGLPPQGQRGVRRAGGGEGAGTKAAATALWPAGAAANFRGRAGAPHTQDLAVSPRSEEPAQRWSALGCRLGPRRLSPQARRPHHLLPRLRPLSPAPRRPRRLRARRTWRRRRSGGTLYLSTGPTACAGTAASSSSSAAQECGASWGGGAGQGCGAARAPPREAAALTGAPLSPQ